MKNPELVIMAAGMGSRYGGLKQIDKVDAEGHIIIDYSIYDAIRAGFRDFTFIIKKEIEKDFREVIDPHGKYGRDTDTDILFTEGVFQRDFQLDGTQGEKCIILDDGDDESGSPVDTSGGVLSFTASGNTFTVDDHDPV